MVYIQENQWVVQKFGGTSLGKLLQTISQKIIPQYLETHRVAVVCSAISGSTKALGTTSLLLLAIDQALASRFSPAPLNATIDTIRDEHLKISELIFNNVISPPLSSIRMDLEDGIVEDCEQLRGFLLATQVKPSPSTKHTTSNRIRRPSENFLQLQKTVLLLRVKDWHAV
jgi:aspartate kinase